MKLITLFILTLSLYPLPVLTPNTTTENKNVTFINGQATSDGKSEVRERLLEDCIVSLPEARNLEAVISSEVRYLKEINGDPARNDFIKMYTASIEINYLLYQKVLFIVTANAIPAHEPVMKEMDKNIRQSKIFDSDPANGDSFAGRSNRQFYYSTPEKAEADARKKAEIWLKQQSAVVCKTSGTVK